MAENKNRKVLLYVAIGFAFFFLVDPFWLFSQRGKTARPYVDRTLVQELQQTWEGVGQAPEQFIVDLARRHQVVFIGEMGRIAQQVTFVADLIPHLYRAGISQLGYQYALSADQGLLDQLVTQPEFDEDLANRILFNRLVIWGYAEYREVLRAAWRVNQEPAGGREPFRIVGLSVRQDFSAIRTEDDLEDNAALATVFANGVPDVHMAEVVLREFVDADRRGVVFSAQEHAFTRYQSADFVQNMADIGFPGVKRMGSLVHDRIGAAAVTVLLHSPWPDKNADALIGFPAAGVIDELIDRLPPDGRRSGFPVVDSAFADIEIRTSDYRVTDREAPPRTLGDMTDGYVVLGPLSDYRSVTPIDGFVTDDNIAATLANFPGPDPGEVSAADINEYLTGLAQQLNRILEGFK